MRIALLLSVSLFVGCNGDSQSSESDAGRTPDTGSAIADAGADANTGDAGPGDAGDALDAGGDAGPNVACADTYGDLSEISGTEGLVIARDGTMYYSQSAAIGRVRPGEAAENNWVTIRGANTVWGLALNAANDTLYAGSPSTSNIYAIDTTSDTPRAEIYINDVGSPNGLTVGPDDLLYFTDFGRGHVYVVSHDGAEPALAQVTTSSVAQANGLAFESATSLLVASYGGGTLLRLTIADSAETARATVASGLGNPDGIAIDSNGVIYVSDNSGGKLTSLTSNDDKTILIRRMSGPASIEFAPASSGCTDLYVATGGDLQYFEAGVAGALVPWH